MLKISVDGANCRFQGEGSTLLLDLEMTSACTAIITHMAKINHCSFETASLILFQQCSLTYKNNIDEFDINIDDL